MKAKKKLSDILKNGSRDEIAQTWDTTKAADDLTALPPGLYVAHISDGALCTSNQKTPGYKLTFKIIEGEYTGRHLWHDVWLTPAALPMAKRDLGRIGITAMEQLEQPLPRWIRCNVRVTRRTGDDGSEYNRVRAFEVLGIDKPEQDAFAPADNPQGDGKPTSEPSVSSAAATPDDAQGNGESAVLPSTPDQAEGTDHE